MVAKATRAMESMSRKSGLPELGYGVFWTIHNSEWSISELEEVLEQTIGASYAPKVPIKKKALRRALDKLESDGFIRKIVDDKEKCAYALVSEEADVENVDIDLRKLSIAVLDKKEGKLKLNRQYKNEEIFKLFDHFCGIHTDVEIRNILTKFIYNNHGIALRETGGVYYLPEWAEVEALKGFVEAVKGEFYFLPIVDNAAAKSQITKLIRDELVKEVSNAAIEVQKIVANEKTQARTYEAKLNQFKNLHDKVQLYVDFLQAEGDSLKEFIRDLEDDVITALTGSMEAFPPAEEFPYQSQVKYNGSAQGKAGQTGTVIGYVKKEDKERDVVRYYVRVLFDDDASVAAVSPQLLECLE